MATHSSILGWRIPKNRGARGATVGVWKRPHHDWASMHSTRFSFDLWGIPLRPASSAPFLRWGSGDSESTCDRPAQGQLWYSVTRPGGVGGVDSASSMGQKSPERLHCHPQLRTPARVSCPTLLWPPMDCSLPRPSVYGISQARILEWLAISSSKGSSQPRDRTHVSCIGRQILFITEPPRKSYYDSGREKN